MLSLILMTMMPHTKAPSKLAAVPVNMRKVKSKAKACKSTPTDGSQATVDVD